MLCYNCKYFEVKLTQIENDEEVSYGNCVHPHNIMMNSSKLSNGVSIIFIDKYVWIYRGIDHGCARFKYKQEEFNFVV